MKFSGTQVVEIEDNKIVKWEDSTLIGEYPSVNMNQAIDYDLDIRLQLKEHFDYTIPEKYKDGIYHIYFSGNFSSSLSKDYLEVDADCIIDNFSMNYWMSSEKWNAKMNDYLKVILDASTRLSKEESDEIVNKILGDWE